MTASSFGRHTLAQIGAVRWRARPALFLALLVIATPTRANQAARHGQGFHQQAHGDGRQGQQRDKNEEIENAAHVRFRRADGQYRWMKSLGTPRFTQAGAFLGYAGCTVDIHDAKLSEIIQPRLDSG